MRPPRPPAPRRSSRPRAGVTFLEVLVVVGILGVGLLLLFLALPAGRETARTNRCMANLRRIGEAFKLYDNGVGHLPGVPAPADDPADWGPGPLAQLLGELGVSNFSALDVGPGQKPPLGPPGTPPPAKFLADLACPSDPNALAERSRATTSYRACTGADADGLDGAFSPGRTRSIAGVQDRDGTSFTAAFAERNVGNGRDEPDPANYALVAGPLGADPCGDAPPAAWRGDAGSSWARAGWSTSLYNHALRPGGSPSCIATDGRTARIGSSSGHPDRIHVLMLDGSLRPVTPRMNPVVWQALARIDDSAAAASPAPAPPDTPEAAAP